jgi:hypothetical protein
MWAAARLVRTALHAAAAATASQRAASCATSAATQASMQVTSAPHTPSCDTGSDGSVPAAKRPSLAACMQAALPPSAVDAVRDPEVLQLLREAAAAMQVGAGSCPEAALQVRQATAGHRGMLPHNSAARTLCTVVVCDERCIRVHCGASGPRGHRLRRDHTEVPCGILLGSDALCHAFHAPAPDDRQDTQWAARPSCSNGRVTTCCLSLLLICERSAQVGTTSNAGSRERPLVYLHVVAWLPDLEVSPRLTHVWAVPVGAGEVVARTAHPQ